MGDKPFLQIEFDEHYSKVGVITRIEAFLNSISHRPPVQVPDGFNILDVDYHPTFITDRPAPDRTVLDRSGHRDTAIAAPILEELPQHAADPDLLLRAVLTGDVLYAALADMRAQLAPQAIPTWEELTRLAAQISALPHGGNRLAAVGSPLCITSLNEGILDTLEREGYQIARIPLVEMLWVLWRDNGTAAPE